MIKKEYIYFFIIAPTISNKKISIKNKYRILAREFKSQNKKSLIKYSYFPINLILRNNNKLFIRESVSLYPFLIILSIFKIKYVLEINGNPVFDSIRIKFLRNIFFIIRKNIVLKNKKCTIYCYSPDESKFFQTSRVVLGVNFLDRNPRKVKLPRNKNILMLVGNNYKWHGINKINLLAKYLKDYKFYIYGINKLDTSLKNVTFYPYTKLEKIIKERDYGYALGSLDYSLKYGSIKSNSTLKGVLYHFLDLPFMQSINEYGSCSKFFLNIGKINNLNKKKLDKINKFLKYWEKKNLNYKELKKFSPKKTIHKILTIFE